MKRKQRFFFVPALLVAIYVFSLFSGVAAAADKPTVTAIEVNQVLGYDISNEDGSTSLMNNFVAGKQTAVFVKLSSEVTVDRTDKTQALHIKCDGNELATLYPAGEKISTDLLEFIPKNMDDMGGWKAGTYDFTATVGDQTLSRTVLFKETQVLNILAVPVKANYGGDVREPGDRWKTANKYLTSVYPVSEKGIDWVEAPMLDCSDSKYDLKTDDGMTNLWKALCDLQVKDENGKDKYTLIIGFVKDRQGASGTTQGYTMGKPGNVVTESDEDMLATVPHEIAHCYNIGDEYSGGTLNPKVNNPPYGMEGKSWDGEGKAKGDKEFVKGDSEKYGDGSIIPESAHPFEYGGRGLMGDKVSYMGSGGKQEYYWTSSAIYDHLFKELQKGAESRSLGSGSALSRMSKESKTRIIEATGWIDKNGAVTVDPWYAEDYYDASIAAVQGAYSINALDAGGKVLASQGFDVSLYNQAANKTLEKAPFDVLVHFPDGTKSFEIRKGTQVLKTIAISANAPVVSITAPGDGTDAKGKMTVAWTGSDADKDKLTYEVWYSPDGSDWTVLGTQLDKTSLTVDFDDLPGSDSGILSVLATDGVNTTEATGKVKVEYKAPEITITEPADTTKTVQYSLKDEIWFSADAYDLQDGWLEDDQVVWTDSEGTVLGDSPELYYAPGEIEAGKYDITVTATNSKGMKSTKTFSIEVGSSSNADAPSSWAREKVDALSARGVIPAALKSGYTMTITRAEFSALITNVYEYAKGAYTVKNATPFTDIAGSPYAAQISKAFELGIIGGTSPTTFTPDGRLTREQCAKIISAAVGVINGTPVSSNAALPYDDAGKIDSWALGFVRYAFENGLMSGSGTSFDPLGNLTRESAMVIAERMIEKYGWTKH